MGTCKSSLNSVVTPNNRRADDDSINTELQKKRAIIYDDHMIQLRSDISDYKKHIDDIVDKGILIEKEMSAFWLTDEGYLISLKDSNPKTRAEHIKFTKDNLIKKLAALEDIRKSASKHFDSCLWEKITNLKPTSNGKEEYAMHRNMVREHFGTIASRVMEGIETRAIIFGAKRSGME